MGAIVGVLRLDRRPLEQTQLARMLASVAHRGPNGSASWCNGEIGLGSGLLHSTPESRFEHQPLRDKHARLVLVADARIDNREELLTALRSDLGHHPAAQISDSELILAAYRRWGEHCPARLLGDFAFAVWDEPKRRLFCARDHYGVRPLYFYHNERQQLVFGSEPKALFCCPDVPRQLNDAKIAAYLTATLVDNNSTFYQHVLRLAPGHCMTADAEHGTLCQRAYWALEPERELRFSTNSDYAEAFRNIFNDAVRCRLRSHQAVGAELSGGLDSSSITCVARQLLRDQGRGPLHSFSVRFDRNAAWDERRYQQAVIDQDRDHIRAHVIQAEELSPFVDIEQLLWHQDEAYLPAHLYFNWSMYKQAQRAGVGVMLDGFDGDTTVSHGNERLRELARAGHWLQLLRQTSAYGRRYQRPWGAIYWNWLWRYGLRSRLVGSAAALGLRQTAAATSNQQIIERILGRIPLNPSFVERAGIKAQLLQARARSGRDAPRTERERHYQILTDDIMQHCLECTNKAASAFAIEPRFPFCDKRLLEFCLAIPADQKLDQGWGRVVMRRAMQDILPSAVQWRVDKADFSDNLRHGLWRYEKARLAQAVDAGAMVSRFVDTNALRSFYERFTTHSASREEVNALHRVGFLELWLRLAKIAS